MKHPDTEKATTLQKQQSSTTLCVCVYMHACICVYPIVLQVKLPIYTHVPGKHYYIICNLVFRRHEKCTEHSI